MKAYFSALIDKSVPSENSKLSKNLIKDFKKLLKTPKSSINLKEYNSFIFIAANKPEEKPIDPKIIEEIQGKLNLRLQGYYAKNKSRRQKDLKGMRELRETSQIVKNFLKEIDPKLPKVFDLLLKKQISELPTKFSDLQINSMITIWNLTEEQKVQLYMSGWPTQVFKVPEVKQEVELEMMVDRLAFLNFFCIFLEPTLLYLQQMNKALERLKLGLQGTHYRSSNSGIQNKLEMFLRILSAKLSSLQNMDKTIFSIFKLFNEQITVSFFIT